MKRVQCNKMYSTRQSEQNRPCKCTYPPRIMEVVAKVLAEINLSSKGIPAGQ